MATKLNPYLNFKDKARDAMEFYKSVFGGELTINTYADYNAAQDPAEANKVMHAQLEAPGGLMFMAADTPNAMDYKPVQGFGMSISGEDEGEIKGYWDKLSAAGTVTMPMEKQVWGDQFGMVTDKFGVSWLVNINAPKP